MYVIEVGAAWVGWALEKSCGVKINWVQVTINPSRVRTFGSTAVHFLGTLVF